MDSPISSPDVNFYEECVVADEDAAYVPPAKARRSSSSPELLKANKDSGRVSKKSESHASILTS